MWNVPPNPLGIRAVSPYPGCLDITHVGCGPGTGARRKPSFLSVELAVLAILLMGLLRAACSCLPGYARPGRPSFLHIPVVLEPLLWKVLVTAGGWLKSWRDGEPIPSCVLAGATRSVWWEAPLLHGCQCRVCTHTPFHLQAEKHVVVMQFHEKLLSQETLKENLVT